MSHTLQQAVRDDDSFLGGMFEGIIEEVTEDIGTVETGDIEIDNSTPPTMVDSVSTWEDIHGEEAAFVVSKPNIGDIFVDETITDKEKWVQITFVGTDPGATTNFWS